MATFRDYVARILPSDWASGLAGGFFGVLGGLTGDQFADGMSLAMRMPWLRDPASPDDVLPLVGEERGLPHYAAESNASYRARLLAAWQTYGAIGEPTIPSQFVIAGYPGVQIQFDAAADGPRGPALDPAPYWSQFWVYFPFSSGHPVTAAGPTWNSFNYGDGTVYGVGVTIDFYQLIHRITSKWKPVRWICRGFKFQLADTSIVEIVFSR